MTQQDWKEITNDYLSSEETENFSAWLEKNYNPPTRKAAEEIKQQRSIDRKELIDRIIKANNEKPKHIFECGLISCNHECIFYTTLGCGGMSACMKFGKMKKHLNTLTKERITIDDVIRFSKQYSINEYIKY